MSFKSDHQISRTFTIRNLTKRQSKSLIQQMKRFTYFIAVILGNTAVKLTSRQKRSQQLKNVFAMEYISLE